MIFQNSKANVKSEKSTECRIVFPQPAILNMSYEVFLLIEKLFYGISKAVPNWYCRYHCHPSELLSLILAVLDSIFFPTTAAISSCQSHASLHRGPYLQTYKTASCSSSAFIAKELKNRLNCKGIENGPQLQRN